MAFLGYGEIGATVLAPLAAHHQVTEVVTHRPEFGGLGAGRTRIDPSDTAAVHSGRVVELVTVDALRRPGRTTATTVA